ncbi:hypothetical protein PF005_g25395 [Phytophthora fragariae]|uniref:Uncharacterized protein n=1 Tax=Phytophthora fragariae TaxID=53985 RepID=A0A6A3W3M8_9STRA|nr:hypothetical protein PF005_g25395 [Phytophthora fragariae]
MCHATLGDLFFIRQGMFRESLDRLEDLPDALSSASVGSVLASIRAIAFWVTLISDRTTWESLKDTDHVDRSERPVHSDSTNRLGVFLGFDERLEDRP